MERARKLLTADGFQWNRDGALLDPAGRPVEFSILVSNNNAERQQMATLIQDDLKQLGMQVDVTPLEFRSLLDRIQRTRDYEACILSFASPDADPNPDLAVWLTSGGNHLWNPGQKTPATPWEAEIDRLMRRQLVTRGYTERKRMFDRVQELLVENQPLVPLVSPNLLVGAKKPGQLPSRADRALHALECGAAVLAAGGPGRAGEPALAGVEQYADRGRMPGGRRARLERPAGSLQEPDLLRFPCATARRRRTRPTFSRRSAWICSTNCPGCATPRPCRAG